MFGSFREEGGEEERNFEKVERETFKRGGSGGGVGFNERPRFFVVDAFVDFLDFFPSIIESLRKLEIIHETFIGGIVCKDFWERE